MDPTTPANVIEAARTSRLAAIQTAEHAKHDALEALRAAANAYMDAVRVHGAALYAEHGPDAPPSPPGESDAFDAALALTRKG